MERGGEWSRSGQNKRLSGTPRGDLNEDSDGIDRGAPRPVTARCAALSNEVHLPRPIDPHRSALSVRDVKRSAHGNGRRR